ncbi:MAG: NADH-quinone oxidoreductase subunit NuoG [Actinomycetota bacterium]|nr:NADH-quinone oxidoreductase subunit NuoG [Actinomycetota bacterium]
MADQPTDAPPALTITVNGASVRCAPGELLIAAAERAGTYIPRFCHHERMKPVGMCRMCLVDVDSGRGPALQPSCMVTVAEGMVVDTESPRAKRAQEGILEMLLVNHPLDCPVCDKGGECPLQDQTVAFGPGESRFVEEKRHYEKPIAISDLVYLDRERCILCDRCTRFAKDVAGDPLIHFIARGNETQVNTFPDHPFASYFSGNTVQICPVGALTAEPYRFTARPWDLAEVESTSTVDTTGARVVLQSSRDRLVRVLGLDSEATNWGWLSDKERFAYEASAGPTRLVEPLRREDDEFVPARWSAASSFAAEAIKDKRVGVLGGARLTVEAQFAWSAMLEQLATSVIADTQLADGLPAQLVLGLPRATIARACAPGGVVVHIGADLKEELPTLFLRLRHAIQNDGVSLIELTPGATSLSPMSAASIHPVPGALAQAARDAVSGTGGAAYEIASRLLASGRPVTVIGGRGNLAEDASFAAEAISTIVGEVDNVRFLPALRRGNVHGALELGFTPGFGPGGVRESTGNQADAVGILEAAANGAIDTLILLGADPLGDVPDADLAQHALAGVANLIAVDLFMTDSCRYANIVLPAAGYGEVDGSFLNLEGRLSPVAAKVTPPGQARSDWMIAVDVAMSAGVDLGFDSLDECRMALSGAVGTFAPVDWSGLARAEDGQLLDLTRDWVPDLVPAVVAPPLDGYGLRLVVDRTLWDLGTMVQESPSLAGLANDAVLSVSREDFERLGVAPGSEVTVTSSTGTHRMAVQSSDTLPRGAARLPFRHAGFDARRLLAAGEAVIEIRVSAN